MDILLVNCSMYKLFAINIFFLFQIYCICAKYIFVHFFYIFLALLELHEQAVTLLRNLFICVYFLIAPFNTSSHSIF